MFPNELKIIITEGETDLLISNIAIQLTIFANHKNDYHIIPKISDENGVINITKEFIENEIEKDRNLFIMDYSSTLSDCKSHILIELFTIDMINNLIEAMKIFPNNVYHNNISSIRNLNNSKYRFYSQIINLTAEKSIHYNMKLEKK